MRSSGVPSARCEFFELSREFAADTPERLDELAAGALCGWRAEYRLCVPQASVRAKRHVTEAEDSKHTDAGFQSAATQYSEHRRSLNELLRRGEILSDSTFARLTLEQEEARIAPARDTAGVEQ